ncbi:hypothetical protein [Microbacterium dextranolyticum]|uniref:hypothetical protein n=1 Tax=Microbacterium dextranolyticum TaxID=36806 RepID=UPI00195CEAE8|nr:hypothetical protein [Microbacterium dextranolyticum]MBM7462168.1 hypothetical protein [Microbacterium dextranolyticum]
MTHPTSSTEWSVHSNAKTYDSESAFRDHDDILWTETHVKIRLGDTVYLYGAAPRSAITHECVVLERGLPFERAAEYRRYWRGEDPVTERRGRTWMRFSLVHTFTPGERARLSIAHLKVAGLKAAPQGRIHLPPGVAALVRDVRGE